MKKKSNNFQSNLVKTQIILIVPLLFLALIGSFSLLYTSTYDKTESAVVYQLNNFNTSLQRILDNTLKLLEKPYNNAELKAILATDYNNNSVWLYRDDRKVSSILYNDIMFYNEYIGAAVIIANNRPTPYLKYASPFLLRSEYDLSNIQQTPWYLEAMSKTSYSISNVYFDPMFSSKDRVITISQQIREPLSKKTLGVIKLNLNFEEIMDTFPSQLLGTNDAFYVRDESDTIIYTSDNYNEDATILFSEVEVKNKLSKLRFTYQISNQSIVTQLLLPYLIIVLAVFTIFFVCFMYINKMSKSISQPIVSLKNSMLEAQQGNLAIRSVPLVGEMQVLANSFNDLMNKMEELIRDIRDQEQEKNALQYELLQSKINPHFLYNSLNALKWKSQSIGATDLSQSIDSLAIFLKTVIKIKNSTISIQDELTLVENYIAIMQIRYDSDVEINYDLDTDLFDYLCPKLILQPIVENCFIHAFNDKVENKQIDIHLFKTGSAVVFTISDNGKGLPQEIMNHTSKTSGIGLKAVDERLRKIYGNEYGIRISSEINCKTIVEIKIPMLKEDQHENTLSG